jgi:hypothetical protein
MSVDQPDQNPELSELVRRAEEILKQIDQRKPHPGNEMVPVPLPVLLGVSLQQLIEKTTQLQAQVDELSRQLTASQQQPPSP